MPIISLPNVAADPLVEQYGLGYTGREDTPVLLAEKIEELARDKDKYDRIQSNVSSLFEKTYNWGCMAQRLEKAYRELLA